jgi:AcrR family transcriptional regulator
MSDSTKAAGRPRDSSLDVALLTATQELLLEHGFDRLSVEAVATRAGVGKAAVYRRWAGKTELVVAAVAELAHKPSVPDTGSLRGDLLESARAYMQNDRTQRVFAGLTTAMVHNEELREAARISIGDPFTDLFKTVILRAAAEGKVAFDADFITIGDVFPALAFHRTASQGKPVDEQFILRVVDSVLIPLLAP